jgi:phosphoglycerate dehydrogenase-like enzyme
MENNSYTVAVLGAGNIGSAVVNRLQHLDNDIVELDLKKVLVSDLSKDREIDKEILTDNFEKF